MEHGSQKAVARLMLAALTLVPLAAAEFRFDAMHDHMLPRKDRPATLVIDEHGVSFQEQGKKPHHGRWAFQDIQELYLSADQMRIVTYEDRRWVLGVDQEYEFRLRPGQDVRPLFELLRSRMDRRFVAALANAPAVELWSLPVKRLGTLRGSQGTLRFGADRIVYETARKEDSRTWRYQDVENISTNDPYQLTLTTFERAVTHYGSRKDFNFQLKQPLDERRFNLVWRRLNGVRGPELLTSISEKGQ